MTLATDIQSDRSTVFLNADEFAETITWAGAEIPAIVEKGEDLAEIDRSSWDDVRSVAIVEVSAADVSPTYRDTVVIGSVMFYHNRILETNGGMHRCELIANQRPTI
jgi:hypothetical protein